MISIIICSHTPSKLEACRANIEKTIGVEHEFVILDNTNNRMVAVWIIANLARISFGNVLTNGANFSPCF